MAKLVDVASPDGRSGEVGVVKIQKEEPEEGELKVNKEEKHEEGGLTVKEDKVEVVEDIAIKKVLQDKRFKVRLSLSLSTCFLHFERCGRAGRQRFGSEGACTEEGCQRGGEGRSAAYPICWH